MTDYTPSASFEEEIKALMAMPQARPEFVIKLKEQLKVQAGRHMPRRSRPLLLRPAWIAVWGIILLLLASILIIGPERVYAAFSQLFGYIPGVGIVNQSEPIRVLAQPVSVTRDGITVTVTGATLTADRTYFTYGVSGVSQADRPKREDDVGGCLESTYLRLPDGTRMDAANVMDKPIPADVNAVIFVMPCIFDTLSGTTPTDWELPLRFVPAPANMTVMPVIELSPTVTAGSGSAPVATPGPGTSTPVAAGPAVTVSQIIQTDDGYILIGAFDPHEPDGSWAQAWTLDIRDATGKDVPYTTPDGVISGGLEDGQWAAQIKAARLTFPLTLEVSGIVITRVAPQASAEVTFDAGPDPQPGQVWTLNQDVLLGGHTLKLVSITAEQNQGSYGYSFSIDPGPDLSGVSVELKGYETNGGGGGGGGGNGQIIDNFRGYAKMPVGKLTVVLSSPLQVSGTLTWQGQWTPEVGLRTDWPTPTAPAQPECITADSFNQISAFPTGTGGQVLLVSPDFVISLVNLDGSEQQPLVNQNGGGELTPGGKLLAYSSQGNIITLDPASDRAAVMQAFPQTYVYWSPDGQHFAYTESGNSYGIFIADANGSNQRQVSNLGNETIAGWSPDGQTLYYAIQNAIDPMNTGGYMLRTIDVPSGQSHDLFVLKDSSGKSPLPTVSPDGKWVAYRGRDLGSLYIMSMDGAQQYLLIEKPSMDVGVSGAAWSQDSNWLGVSMNDEVIVMRWKTCEVYRVPQAQGELDGLLMP
jgi:WD40-like Beta Propeller Repeat